MKFHLLVAASALVVGLGMSGVAFAGNDNHGHDGHGNNDPSTTSVGVAVALSDQDGASVFNFAKGTVGNNTIGSVGGTGLVNIQQNNGANSVLQDQNTLGAILNCSCSSSDQVLGVSLAASDQSALVLGNVSIGASNKTSSGSAAAAGSFSESSGKDDDHGHGHDDSHGHDDGGSKSGSFAAAKTWSNTKTAVASNNTLSSFSGTGLYNISQNNGNNSVLQSGNTVAAIVGK